MAKRKYCEYRGFHYLYIKSTGLLKVYYHNTLIVKGFESTKAAKELIDYLIDDGYVERITS